MVIGPSPSPADPDVSRRGTDWHSFYDRRRHWSLADRSWSYHDRSGSHDDWGWNRRKRDSEVEFEMNSGVYSCDSCSRQNQNCNCLFHNIYLTTKFDVRAAQNIITRELPFCKAVRKEKAFHEEEGAEETARQ